MSNDIVYSFIVYEVSVAMDEQDIKDDLMGRYEGVEKVTRMFYKPDDDSDDVPKASVQVDFTLPNDAEKIYRDKSIVLGGICRRVYAVKKPAFQQPSRKPREYQPRKSKPKPLCEQDLVNLLEEQNQSLTELFNSFDKKLNEAINRQQGNTTQRALSNKA